MADLSITPASVIADSGYGFEDGTAGATITQGQLVYKDSSNLYQLTDADALITAAARGIALQSVSINQPLRIQTAGSITIGATVVVGQTYAASVTPGAIGLYSDLASGDFVSLVGIGVTAAKIALGFKVSGIAKA